MKLAKNEYLLAGTGVVASFATEYEKNREERKVLGEDGFVAEGQDAKSSEVAKGKFAGPRKGIGTVDEVCIDSQGQMHFLRRHNGDQSHQGRHVRIACGEWKMLHVVLYDY